MLTQMPARVGLAAAVRPGVEDTAVAVVHGTKWANTGAPGSAETYIHTARQQGWAGILKKGKKAKVMCHGRGMW